MQDRAKDINTLAAAWKLLDAERMANESLLHQLAEKDAQIERLKASCKQVGEANERLGIRVIEAERTAAGSQAREQRLRNALEKMTDVFLDTEGNHGPCEQEAFEMAYKALEN